MTHFNLLGVAADRRRDRPWHNRLRSSRQATRLGIPVTISTDPRHAFTDNPGTALMLAGPFSQWPEPLGLAATRDEALVERFARHRPAGVPGGRHPRRAAPAGRPRHRAALGARQRHLRRGRRPDRAARRRLHPRVPGRRRSGPTAVVDDDQALPRRRPAEGRRGPALRLRPRAGLPRRPVRASTWSRSRPLLAAGTRQMMPYYGMPVGTEYEEVGFGFNKPVITGLLREQLGFDGIVCTDWGLITDAEIIGQPFPARAWGVEHLTPSERVAEDPRRRRRPVRRRGVPRAAASSWSERAGSPRSGSTLRPAPPAREVPCSASSTSPLRRRRGRRHAVVGRRGRSAPPALAAQRAR